MTNNALIRHDLPRTDSAEAGDLFCQENKAYILAAVPHGPDSNHVTYNLISLETGQGIWARGFESTKELLVAARDNFKLIKGSVTLSRKGIY